MNRIIILSIAILWLASASLYAQKVGIGTNTPTERLHVNGNFRLDGEFKPNNDAGQAGQVLKSRGVGFSPEWGDASAGADINGTINYLARFTSTTALRIGQVQDDMTQILIKRTAGLPTADLNAYFTVEAPGVGPGSNNQRVAIKGLAVDSAAVQGIVTGATGSAALEGVSRSTALLTVNTGVRGAAGFNESSFGGPNSSANYAWANIGATTSTSTAGIQTAPTGGVLLPTGIMGFGGTEGSGVTGFSTSNEQFASGVFGLSTNLAAQAFVFQAGVFGETSNQMYGVIGLSSRLGVDANNAQNGSGIGVSGRTLAGGGSAGVEGFAIEATASTGTGTGTFGVLGRSSSTTDSSAGVWGIGRDKNNSGGINFGVRGDGHGTGDNSAGIFGTHKTTNGVGVYGTNTVGNAVKGEIIISTNTNAGILGLTQATTTDAKAILGYAKGGTAIKSFGVLGWNEDLGNGATGVLGETFDATAANPNFGVSGVTAGTNANSAGIRGEGPGAWAGWFQGKVRITGDLECNGGNKLFVIDHPLDPANKYLKHACIESNEVLNLYSGTATTSGIDNEAIVKMPDYFEALNTDFRYQLTCINQFANAIIIKEISNNTFVIKTDKPNVKVSWVVYAKRNDILNRQKPFVAEVMKEPINQGKYLAASAYKMPIEKQIGYMTTPKPDAKLKQKVVIPSNPNWIDPVIATDKRIKQMEIDLLERSKTPTNVEVPANLKQFIPRVPKGGVKPISVN